MVPCRHGRQAARVTYFARQGDPYRIGKIGYRFRDRSLRPVVLSDTASSLLRTGGIFDGNVLNDERSRIASFLKNRGYYNFSINNIEYVADSTAGDRTIDLTMVVKPYMAGYTPEGEPIVEENRVYRLRDIYVFPGYDPAKAVSDSLYNSRLDTTLYRGLKIVYDARPKVRSSILRRTVNLYPNALYNESDVKRTYENIMRLGYYKSASVLFSEASDSAGRDSPVTYIGGLRRRDRHFGRRLFLGTVSRLQHPLHACAEAKLLGRAGGNHLVGLLRADRDARLPEPQSVPRRGAVRRKRARRV